MPASGTTVGRFSGVTIADNTFTGLTTGITLSNNNSTGVISTTGLIDDATISGNRITGSGGAAITTRGIRLRGSVLGTTISGNTISTMGTGILIQGSAGSNPVLTVVDFNRIVGNTVGMDGGPAVFVDGDLNWWGCNTGPNTAGCDTTLGAVDADPWLVLGFSPLPASPVQVGGTTTFAVTTVRTSSGGVPAAGVPHNPTVTYGSAVLGTVAPPSAPLAGGVGPTITYTALGPGGNAVTATLDNATITAPITNVQQQQSPATRACSAATPAAGFTDVAAGDAHTGAIDCLVALGIANGKSATTYDPTGAVTRGQMASFIARSFEWAGVVLPVGPDAFDDDDGDVHEAAINQLAAAGIVHGTGGRSFQPGAPLSRAQAATFVVRTFERISGTTLPAPPSSFTDTAGNVHATNIDKAAAAGIVLGTTPTTFGPDGTTTRAQMASLIVRMLDKLVAGGFAP